MTKKIKVAIKRPDSKLYLTNVSNSLKNLQNIVGGRIETITLCSDLVIICNEEGMINNLPYNLTICGLQFFGTILFAGVKRDEFFDIPCAFKELKRLLGMHNEEESK